ncbi:BrnT family toxin [Patescibacteria group bacterium]|nr:BrnT family toxin [Patescibacteria group bacterium]
MVQIPNPKEFQWDKGNIFKNYSKHGITTKESEEIILDSNVLINQDIKHSQKEKRFIAIGKTFKNKILFVIYTIRKNKIRIISARIANKKEKYLYAKKT